MQVNTLTSYGRRFPTAGKFFAVSMLAAWSVLAAGEEAPVEVLKEVEVIGRYEFLDADTSGTTGLPLPIEKVPQSISLVSEDFLKAANLKTIGDVADYTAGVVNNGPYGNFAQNVNVRGFSPIRSIDGINVSTSGGAGFEPDHSNFDRIEIVKGPSSVVYGVSSAGGLVNYITKSATPQTVDYFLAEFGMWDNHRVEGQVSGSLDSSGRVEAIGVVSHEKGDSFVNVVNHERTSFYGGINAELGESVTAYLHGGYDWWMRTATDGLPTYPDGTYPSVPRSFFMGGKDDNFTTPAYHASTGLTWRASDMLEFDLRANYQDTNMSGDDPFAFNMDANGNLILNKQKITCLCTSNYGVSLSSIYKFDALGLENSFVSAAAQYQNSDFLYAINLYQFPNGDLTVPSNISVGEAELTRIFDSASILGPPVYNNHTELEILTLSVQSVLEVVDSVSVLLGASYSKADVFRTDLGSATQDFSPPNQTSLRIGATYEFLTGFNAYLSYSESYVPQVFIDPDRNVLPPLIGEQYEGGLKYRSPNSRLLLTGALFQIAQQNQPIFHSISDLGGSLYTPAGEVKHEGFEFEAVGQISPQWQINASYTYLDAKITKDPSNPGRVGQSETFIPNQTASVFLLYTVGAGSLEGLTVGGGARYVGSQETSIPNSSSPKFPGYTLLDATVSYAKNSWSVQLNARNILDEFYLYNDYQTLGFGNFVGTPADVVLTVRRDF